VSWDRKKKLRDDGSLTKDAVGSDLLAVTWLKKGVLLTMSRGLNGRHMKVVGGV